MTDRRAQLRAIYGVGFPEDLFEALPPSLGECPALERLDLADNRLRELPAWLGRVGTLRELNLSGNQLTSLPADLTPFRGLARLDLQRNPLPVEALVRARASLPGTDVLPQA